MNRDKNTLGFQLKELGLLSFSATQPSTLSQSRKFFMWISSHSSTDEEKPKAPSSQTQIEIQKIKDTCFQQVSEHIAKLDKQLSPGEDKAADPLTETDVLRRPNSSAPG